MNPILWIALSSVALLTSAHAASFDCRKAQSQVERLICGNAKLSELDDRLDEVYRQALERADTKGQTTLSQRQWLRNERNACQTEACLEVAYTQRIRELGLTKSFGIVILSPDIQPNALTATLRRPDLGAASTRATLPQKVARTQSNSARTINVCRAVAEAANQLTLSKLLVDVPIESQGVQGKLIDINNDGRLERVIRRSNDFVAFDRRDTPLNFYQNEKDDWSDNALRWADNRRLIRYRDQTYILGSTGDTASYLTRISRENIESVVCQFAQNFRAFETLLESANDKLCRAAAKNSLQYVDFIYEHGLTDAAIFQAGIRETIAGNAAAEVDIDGDDELDRVVNLSLASGRGRGCGAESLGILNKANDGLDMGRTNLLPEPGCNAIRQRVFVFEGQSYVEIKYQSVELSNVYRIVQLKRDRLQTICEFGVLARSEIEVLSESDTN